MPKEISLSISFISIIIFSLNINCLHIYLIDLSILLNVYVPPICLPIHIKGTSPSLYLSKCDKLPIQHHRSSLTRSFHFLIFSIAFCSPPKYISSIVIDQSLSSRFLSSFGMGFVILPIDFTISRFFLRI